LRNPQTVQPSLIDFAGYGGMPGRGHRVPGRRSGEPSHGRHAGRGTGYLAAGCFDHLSPRLAKPNSACRSRTQGA
jgi:hypothetical protein